MAKTGVTPRLCVREADVAKGLLQSSQVGISYGIQGVYCELLLGMHVCVFNILKKTALENKNKPIQTDRYPTHSAILRSRQDTLYI